MHGSLFIGLNVSAINVKTAELIGPKLCVSVGPHMTPGKVSDRMIKFKKLASNKIRLSLNFKKSTRFFL